MSRAFVQPWRLRLVTLMVLGCFGALLWKLVDLHVVKAGQLAAEAEHNRETFDVLYARRGNVLDQRGNILATTRSVFEVGVDPKSVTAADMAKLPKLSQLIDVPVEQLEKSFTTKVHEVQVADVVQERQIRWTPLQEGLDDATFAKVQALGIKAIYGNRKFERVYPGAELGAHILGYVTRDGEPEAGVEKYLDFYLRGQDGWRETEHDGHKHELAQFNMREVPPADGLNVELTVDMMLQYYAQQEVKRIVEQYHPTGVTIIIGDPTTGEILALANAPDFNPNHYWDYPADCLNDRATNDVYEPGSVFKIVTAAAALNEGLVTPDQTFDCAKPTIEFEGRVLKLPEDAEHNGILTVSQIVSRSSNRGAANMGVLLGEQRLYDYASAFGFGQKTGFGLAGESNGDLRPINKWDGLMITRVPMGHAVNATPLQVHMAMSAVANHGVLMQPMLVRRVFDTKGQTVVAFSPQAKRRVISTDTAEKMNLMLRDVVGADGTAQKASLLNITVAGKTGTTQKIVDGHYSTEHHVATFAGFFPAERPRLVITVVVDDANEKITKGTAFGGTISAPAFHNVAQLAVQYLGIQPVNSGNTSVAMKGDNLDWFR